MDEYTYKIRITTKESDATLLFNLGDRGTYIRPPSAFPDGDVTTAKHIPLGTRPYKVVGKRLQDHAAVERFDGYYKPGGVAFLDRMEFFKVIDPTVRLASVRAGDIDIIEAAPLEAADRVLTNPNLGYLLKAGNLRSSMGFRTNFPPFDNVHVRRAFAHAIDRDAINKAAFFGLATPNANYMWPGHWAFDANFKGLPYDLNKARQELALAGFARGLKVEAAIWNCDPPLTVAQIVQDQVKAVGIEVILNPFDSVTAGELVRQGRYGLSIGGTGSRDAQPLAQLDILDSRHPQNKDLAGGYNNPEIDALFKVLRTNPDPGARTRAMKRVNDILMVEDLIEITFVDVPEFFVWNAKLRGVEVGYSYFMRINSVWWAETPKPGPLK